MGFDLRDINGDGRTDDARLQMGDPSTASPASSSMVALQGSPDIDDAVIYAPTNDGYLHAINAKTGAELWSFIPPELLGNLVNLYLDDPSSGEALLVSMLTCDPSCSTSTGTVS